MVTNMLKLNQEKFEYIVFHPRQQSLNPQNFGLLFGDTTRMPYDHIGNLDVHKDRYLGIKNQVSAITKAITRFAASVGFANSKPLIHVTPYCSPR